ncbi:Potassium channel toxin kappa-KTx 5.1, partial [Dissostichus eleginoides]
MSAMFPALSTCNQASSEKQPTAIERGKKNFVIRARLILLGPCPRNSSGSRLQILWS